MEQIAKIKITGLYLKSAKIFINFHTPLEREVFFDNGDFYRYKIKDPTNSYATGYYVDMDDKIPTSIEEHMDLAPIQGLLTQDLVSFRTMLKHVYDEGYISLFGTVSKNKKTDREEYTITWNKNGTDNQIP